MVATAVFEELQVAEAKACGPPPLKLPVAVRLNEDPIGTHGWTGLTETESSPGGVRVVGWYNSALPRIALPLYPPPVKTFPLLRSVALWT
jgi:hypothetical protein